MEIQEELDFVEEALRKEGLPPSGRLLELGCGEGSLTLSLACKGYQAYGIDIAPTAVAWAQEKAQKQGLAIDFRAGDITDLPYPDDFFDVVVDGHCLHCIIGEDRGRCLSQVFRITRPGGLFLVNTMCDEPQENLRDGYDPETRCIVREGVAVRYFGRSEDILREISSSGFIVKSSVVSVDASSPQQAMLYAVAVKPGQK